ncbi:MAG: helix-turn-helix transcriptional regulator [Lachnospiraceae bacterium]|nr:helix-turn-helix transcriptional regulator [Lachnospiraceae bacterium]
MIDILKRIDELRLERSWTEYELSKQADIPQSTISTWYRKKQNPTLHSLEKLSDAFGIPLSALFADKNDLVELSEQEREVLHFFQRMTSRQRVLFLDFLKSFNEDSL